MNAPPAPDDYTSPLSAVLVPVVVWEQIKDHMPEDSPLRANLERLEETELQHADPEEGSIPYQVMDVLAKADLNMTEHMSRHTLVVMYGEMARTLDRTFTITRKDQKR